MSQLLLPGKHTRQAGNNPVKVVVVVSGEMNCQLIERAFRPRRYRLAIVGSATDSAQALKMLKEHEPDVAVISAQLGDGPLEGFQLLRDLRALHLKTRATLLLETRDREIVVDAFRCGAHGVVFRDEPLETLSKCIHMVHRGQIWASSEYIAYIMDTLAKASPFQFQKTHNPVQLSKREVDVVGLVAEGMTNRQISTELKLSEHTIRNYLFRIFDKLGVSTRVELVLYCLQHRQNGSSA